MRLFGDNAMKGRCNEAIIERFRRRLQVVRTCQAHMGGAATPAALGDAAADHLAVLGSSGFSSTVAGFLSQLRCPCVSSPWDPLRRARRTSRGRDRDPRVLPVTHYLDVILRVATACSARCRRTPVPPAAFGINFFLRV